MKSLIRTLFLFTLLFFIANKTQASHIVGGDVSYENVGQDSFLVRVVLFRDCSGITGPATVSVNLSSTCGGAFTTTLVNTTSTEISQLCPTQIANSTCNGGAWLGLMEYVYEGVVYVGPSCNSWTISWSSCCKPSGVTNLLNSGALGTYLYAKLYSGSFGSNSSPRFGSAGTPTVFTNQVAHYNFGATDTDGDSLVYFMSPGYSDATTLIPYATNYSYQQPFSTSITTTLNASTGQLSFTPTMIGIYSLNVRVEEYDRHTGVLKGTIHRDMIVNVTSSSNQQPEFSSNGMVNLGGGTVVNNRLTICLTDSVNVNITVLDTNTADVLSIAHNIYDALDSTAVVTISGVNPVTINIKWTPSLYTTGNRDFFIEAADDKCPFLGKSSEGFGITIISSAYAGLDESICSGDSVTLKASGGSTFIWTVLSGLPMDTNSSSTGYNATCMNCEETKVFPNATTTYLLISNLTGGCSNIDTVTVNVGTAFSINSSSDTAICLGQSIGLNVTASNSALTYGYNWSPSSTLSADSINNPIATPSKSAKYTVEVFASNCSRTAKILVDVVNVIPVGNEIYGDSVMCVGDSLELNLEISNSPITVCGINTRPLVGLADSGVIGTGINVVTPNDFPNPYGRYYWGVKNALLYTKSELINMGLQPGSAITGVSFDVSAVGVPSNVDNFKISIGCTSDTVFSLVWPSGLSDVLAPYTYNPVTGWNLHEFDSSFIWDGNSSLIIETCYNNSNYSAAATSTVKYSITTDARSAFFRADNNSVCSSNLITNTSLNRPNIKFHSRNTGPTDGLVFNWSPLGNINLNDSITVTVSPSINTTYQVVISDSQGVCFDTATHDVEVISTPYDASFLMDSAYCILESQVQFVPSVSGGIFTGTSVTTSGLFNPSQAGTGIWPINYNIPLPAVCSNDSTQMANVIAVPDVTINPIEVCIGGSPVVLTSATSGGTWQGTGVTDSIQGIFDPTGLPAGNYLITYSLDSICSDTTTEMIRIVEPYQFVNSVSNVDLCLNASVNLSQFAILTTHPLQGANPVLEYSDVNGYVDSKGVFNAQGVAPNTYQVTVTVGDSVGGCGQSKTINVKVWAEDYPYITPDPSFCSSETQAHIFVHPWLFGTGVSFSQVALGNLQVGDTLNIYPYGQNGEFVPQNRGEGSWELTINYINSVGCLTTTVDTIYVLAPPVTPLVTNLGVELIVANAELGYLYQWVDCNDNMSFVPGETSTTFVPGKQGDFAVWVNAGNCVSKSNCEESWPVGINYVNQLEVEVYPNPVSNKLTIDLKGLKNVQIEILDNTGKTIVNTISSKKEQQIDFSQFSSGVYFVKLISDSGSFTKRIVKE